MDWQAFGSIAEIVSAIAVLVTLIYLALQIRQNSHSIDQQNAIAKSQSLQQRADSVTQLSTLTLGSEENVAVYTKLLSNKSIGPADLEPNERMRAILILHPLRANLENTFLQYRELLRILRERKEMTEEYSGSQQELNQEEVEPHS